MKGKKYTISPVRLLPLHPPSQGELLVLQHLLLRHLHRPRPAPGHSLTCLLNLLRLRLRRPCILPRILILEHLWRHLERVRDVWLRYVRLRRHLHLSTKLRRWGTTLLLLHKLLLLRLQTLLLLLSNEVLL